MSSGWEREPDPQKWRPYRYWAARSKDRPSFVVDGLIHSSATIWTGLSKSGKTKLLTSAIAAVARKDDAFLGRRVRPVDGPILMAFTDLDEAEVVSAHLAAADIGDSEVYIEPVTRATYAAMLDGARFMRPGLIVVDHALGLVPGDVRDNQAGSVVLDPLSGLSCPRILVHHSSTNPQERGGGSNKRPMGSTVFPAWARHVVHVDNSGTRIDVTSYGNQDAERSLILDVAFSDLGVPSWELRSDQAKVPRKRAKQETHDDRVAWGHQHLVGNPVLQGVTSQREAARRLGVDQTKVNRAITAAGLVKDPAGGWRSPP